MEREREMERGRENPANVFLKTSIMAKEKERKREREIER